MTENVEYSKRLQRLELARWKRLLDVQRPYRKNLQRLKLGFALDVGCGIGRNLLHLSGSGVGVDHNAESISIARQRGLEAYLPEEFKRTPHAKAGAFDSLLVAHVVEHMTRSDAVELLGEYLPYVKMHGRVVVIVPQEAGFRSDATHVEFVDSEDLKELARSAGLDVERVYSQPFPRFVGKVFKHNESILVARVP